MIHVQDGQDEAFASMVESARNALKVVLSVKEGERLLVVYDEEKRDIAESFKAGAERLGAITGMYLLPGGDRPLKEIPKTLEGMLNDYDVFINTFKGLAEETPFRVKLLGMQTTGPGRVGHAPGITREMMCDGPMDVDFNTIAISASRLMEMFRGAISVHVTAPGGTDLTLDIKDRDFHYDVRIDKGEIGNLPAGEIWCAPVEDGTNGVAVIDGSIGDVGPVDSPLRITIEGGRVRDIECEDGLFRTYILKLLALDDMADVIGELGIGLNPKARLSGNLLEEEKAGRTAHIAFGHNADMSGGRNTSVTHRDFLFHRPRMVARYADGSERTLLDDGEIVDV